MTAVDTNVLVRFLTGDDAEQAAAARSVFASSPVWIAKTVLLETGWVLRRLYGFEESAIRDAFIRLLGLKNVQAVDESAVAAALAQTTHVLNSPTLSTCVADLRGRSSSPLSAHWFATRNVPAHGTLLP
jgi:predicted nucleic-acid-binding protein